MFLIGRPGLVSQPTRHVTKGTLPHKTALGYMIESHLISFAFLLADQTQPMLPFGGQPSIFAFLVLEPLKGPCASQPLLSLPDPEAATCLSLRGNKFSLVLRIWCLGVLTARPLQ